MLMTTCSRNVKSGPEAVIEHLVGRQSQPRGAQVQPERLEPGPTPSQTSFKGWQWRWGYLVWRSLPTCDLLRVSSFFSFVSACMAAAFGLILVCCSLGLCHPDILLYFPSHYSITPPNLMCLYKNFRRLAYMQLLHAFLTKLQPSSSVIKTLFSFWKSGEV